MVSLTKRSERRRAIRQRRAGRLAKKRRARQATPPFPLHPEGYDPNAPDAKKAREQS